MLGQRRLEHSRFAPALVPAEAPRRIGPSQPVAMQDARSRGARWEVRSIAVEVVVGHLSQPAVDRGAGLNEGPLDIVKRPPSRQPDLGSVWQSESTEVSEVFRSPGLQRWLDPSRNPRRRWGRARLWCLLRLEKASGSVPPASGAQSEPSRCIAAARPPCLGASRSRSPGAEGSPAAVAQPRASKRPWLRAKAARVGRYRWPETARSARSGLGHQTRRRSSAGSASMSLVAPSQDPPTADVDLGAIYIPPN